MQAANIVLYDITQFKNYLCFFWYCAKGCSWHAGPRDCSLSI